jgi:hypothetical protein
VRTRILTYLSCLKLSYRDPELRKHGVNVLFDYVQSLLISRLGTSVLRILHRCKRGWRRTHPRLQTASGARLISASYSRSLRNRRRGTSDWEVSQLLVSPIFPPSPCRDCTYTVQDRLLALEAEPTVDTRRNLYRLLRYVKNLLPNPDLPVMDDAAATLGKIYRVGGTEFAVPVIENEVQRAVELMTNDRAEQGRYAGILILTELATQASVPFWAHANPILEKVVSPIRDTRVRASSFSNLPIPL